MMVVDVGGVRLRKKPLGAGEDVGPISMEEDRVDRTLLSDGGVISKVAAGSFAWLHTILVFGGFLGTLLIGWYYHYTKIVKNEFYGFPDEWFPSISATIGDWAPERNFFQLCMAAASGPRFLLVFTTYAVIKGGLSKYRESGIGLNQFLLLLGITRNLAAGGWIFVTSTDSHPVHEAAMIGYLVASFFYHLIQTHLMSKARGNHLKWIGVKLFFTFLMIVDLGPLIYFYIQHKEHKIPGAYTMYAFFEWSLIFFDVGFDATSVADFATVSLLLVDSQAETEAEREKNKKYSEAEDKAWHPSNFGVIRKFVVDIYLGYVSWTQFTCLAMCIWYFPLLDLGISGYEIALLAPLAAVVNGNDHIRRFVQQNRGIVLLFSLIGLAAFKASQPTLRLALAGLGVAADSIALTAQWWEPTRKDHALMTHLLGLVFLLVVKVFYTTNNPLWPTMIPESGGLNFLGLVLTGMAAMEVLFRKNEKPQFDPSMSSFKTDVHWIVAALAFGSITFLTHHFFTDYSVISNWVLVGYPNPGPMPFPWGLLVIVCVVCGLNLSVGLWTSHPLWWVVGFAGSVALYFAPTYLGFAGGLVLALYIFSVWPLVVHNMVQHPPGRTLVVGFLVYVIWILVSVWVVAYPFVPGGVYLRERTHVFLFGSMFLVFLGTRGASPWFLNLKKSSKEKAEKRLNTSSAILLGLTLLAAASRIPWSSPTTEQVPSPKSLTVAVWAVRFGYDAHMRFNHQRVADALRVTQGDVFALVETDTTRGFLGNRDIVQWVAEKLGMNYDFGPATRNHTWGCALITKYPILWSEHLLLPSPEGELACGIHATLDVGGTKVDILTGHNGNEEHVLDRHLQSKELSKILASTTNPVVYAGYVTTSPGSEDYNVLTEDSGANDIDPSDRDRWCLYIFYKGLERVAYGRISHADATDTEIQVGKFLVGTGKDNDIEIPEAEMPNELRLPEAFKRAGINGHRYHVFERPKYFGTEEEAPIQEAR